MLVLPRRPLILHKAIPIDPMIVGCGMQRRLIEERRCTVSCDSLIILKIIVPMLTIFGCELKRHNAHEDEEKGQLL